MYYTKYKCRLCGETFTVEATHSKDVVMKCMLHALNGIEYKELMKPELYTAHFCNNGNVGVADFQGFKLRD